MNWKGIMALGFICHPHMYIGTHKEESGLDTVKHMIFKLFSSSESHESRDNALGGDKDIGDDDVSEMGGGTGIAVVVTVLRIREEHNQMMGDVEAILNKWQLSNMAITKKKSNKDGVS